MEHLFEGTSFQFFDTSDLDTMLVLHQQWSKFSKQLQ